MQQHFTNIHSTSNYQNIIEKFPFPATPNFSRSWSSRKARFDGKKTEWPLSSSANACVRCLQQAVHCITIPLEEKLQLGLCPEKNCKFPHFLFQLHSQPTGKARKLQKGRVQLEWNILINFFGNRTVPEVAFKASGEFKLGSENNLSSSTFSTVSLAHNKLSNLTATLAINRHRRNLYNSNVNCVSSKRERERESDEREWREVKVFAGDWKSIFRNFH